jgi:beta-barrel assembly-enhancing protease
LASTTQFKKVWASLFALYLLAGCGSYLPSRVPFVQPVQEDEEVKISRQFRKEAKKRLKFVNNFEVERYVDKVGRRLLSVMGPQPFEYRYFVVEDSELNAFAVPGGSIYLYTGLLDRVRSTAELAAVMAHETIHVKGRHMARMSGPDPLSLLGILGAVLARGGAGAQAAGAVGQAIAVQRQIGYTRQLEMEADTLGVRYMAEAGYDPQAAVNFLKTLDQERVLNPVDIPPYLMDHPLSQERVANVELLMRSLKPNRPPVEEADPIKKIQTLIRLERHEADAVIAEQKKSLSQSPKNGEPAQLLGVAYSSKGMWPEARENFERARTLNPKGPGIDRDLGQLYTRIQEYRLAHEAFDRALSVEPKEPLNYLFLGDLCEQESNLSTALDAYLTAVNLAPLWSEPARRVGIVYGKMNRLGDAYYYLGRSDLLQDEDEKAIADFERALKALGPSSPRGQLIKEEIQAIKARKR